MVLARVSQAISLAVSLLLAPYRIEAAELWLAGVDPIGRRVLYQDADADYVKLFQSNISWPRASNRVQVFKTSTRFLAEASDQQIKNMIDGLKRLNISLAFEAPMLTGSSGCGTRVEGYGPVDQIELLGARIQHLGGELSYVAMDEPLWFGHNYDGANGCRTSIADIAQDVAAKVVAIRRSFPAVRVGDIEPVGQKEPSEWLDQVAEWMSAYRAAVG